MHRGQPHKPVDACPHQVAAFKDIGDFAGQHPYVPLHVVGELAGLARARIKAVNELHHTRYAPRVLVKRHHEHGFSVVSRGLVKIIAE